MGTTKKQAEINVALGMNPDGTYPCKACGDSIDCYEICRECAQGNDPFFSSKYAQGFHAGEYERGCLIMESKT